MLFHLTAAARDGVDMEMVEESNLKFFHCLNPPAAVLASGGEAWEAFAGCNKPGYLKKKARKKQWKSMITRALTVYLRARDTERQQAEAEGRTGRGAATPTPSDVAAASEAEEKRWALTHADNKAAAASRASFEALANEQILGTCCLSNDEFDLLLFGQLPMLLRCRVRAAGSAGGETAGRADLIEPGCSLWFPIRNVS
jgi:hypothetical protein